ncbi:hypothetical protein GGS23DRAFT_262374 [Durotheca rogersii]|uniref:uncharacterized protein n=1 Tax=Durotheca rogersii TaxID=419775 RepID=UPI002220DE9D|nr:uncharacterized protein GGS23DRAFT_262374 [Durotheca rogersii]KAI5859817.1 hypothetical protein GGS23DRAFT_262374 [Durotheca rogersii]
MTDNPPQVLATADLTPVSPAPLHPPSPVIVLQDQADALYTMSLPNDSQAIAGFAAASRQPAGEDPNGILAVDIQDDTHSTNATSTTSSNEIGLDDDSSSEDQEAEDEDEGAPLAIDEEKAQHPGQQGAASAAAAAEIHQDVSKTIDSTLNSDTSHSLRKHSELVVPAHEVSSTSTTQSAHQSVPSPSPQQSQGPRELQEPPGHAVVPLSTNHPGPSQPPTTDTSAEQSDVTSNAANNEIDIQSLVDKIIGNAPTSDASQASVPQSSAATLPATSQASSLPPRPPMPQQPAQSPYVRPEDALMYQQALSHSGVTTPSSIPPPPGTYPAGAPGTAPDARSNLPPPPAPSHSALAAQLTVPQFDHVYAAATATSTQPPVADQPQKWETFLQEERRYVSEAKWDRFPDGSRLFIGNLSSDRVSKKEVFDIFSKYGRLAQISLKQAYGFVQYHLLAEGEAAMEKLQGIEVRGRKIHLEFSRSQKKDNEGEKRGNRNKRDNDRHDGGRARRDDYRPGSGRQSSPRRGSHRQQNSYDDSRSYRDGLDSGRGRSRSPGYGRRDSAHYRRRSPSPYRRHSSGAELDIPRRYGGEIPDVQFLLLQEVERDFVSWVEGAFVSQGLKVHVMFLNPHFPRDAVIHRQVVEGVHAVVELDFHARQSGTISLQVFDRSAGRDNVRYDQYRDLDPLIAAQLVTRTKTQAQMPPYNVPYPPMQQYPQTAPSPYLAAPYPNQHYAGGAAPGGPAGSSLDPATLQRILGTLGQQGGPQGPPPPGHPAGGGPHGLAGYGANNPTGSGGPNMHHGVNYPTVSVNGTPGPPGDSAQHVQNIMAQLARYRQ